MKRLFKIQNVNASTIRTVMVAHCRRHDNPDLLVDYDAQCQARRQKGQQRQPHQPLLFDLGTSSSEEEDEEDAVSPRDGRCHGTAAQAAVSSLEHLKEVSRTPRWEVDSPFSTNLTLMFAFSTLEL